MREGGCGRRRDLAPGRFGAAGMGGLEALEARTLLAFDPTPAEQYMLELLNHMRADPAANLERMTSSLSGTPARSRDSDIDRALRQFNVSGPALAEQWEDLTPVPPLAWNEALYEAAEFHNGWMIQEDDQEHQLPGEPGLAARIQAAGYEGFSTAGENIFAYSESVLYGHAGFAIDWGNDEHGIQTPPGHRINMMSASFREVGIRITTESNPSTSVGPLVVTQDFGNRFNFGNPFLLGVVYDDTNGDGFYRAGEGLGGVEVRIVGSGGTFTVMSMSAGGYQVQVPPGVYDITFSGAGFGAAITHRNVIVTSQNIKVDGVRNSEPPQPEIVILGNGVEIGLGDTTPSQVDGTGFGSVNLAQTATRVFTIRNTGGAPLQLTGSPRVSITGEGAGSFTLLVDAPGLLLPGEEATFAIRFDPPNARYHVATVTIESDDPDEGSYTFRIRAKGQNAPDIVVAGGPTLREIRSGDTTPTVAEGSGFNTVNVSNRTRLRTFTIVNTGSKPLIFNGANGAFVRITGVNASDFRVVTQPAASVAPGGTTTFSVRFNPSAAGVRKAQVRIATNDPDERTFVFDVRGRGVVAPILRILGAGIAIGRNDLPSEQVGTQFGAAAVGGAAVVRVFTIRNVGSAEMLLSGMKRRRAKVEGAGAAHFRIGVQPPRVLAPGQTATFRVRFIPGSEGPKLAQVVIDTLNAGSFTFNIAGTGV